MQPPRWLEVVTWSVGLALLVAYGAAWAWSEHARLEGIQSLREIRNSHSAGTPASQPRTRWWSSAPDQTLWSATRVSAFRQVSLREAPEGVLRIPALTLEVPVYGSTSETHLNRGAGHIEGTASVEAPGNVGIAAHRDGFFRNLKDAQRGQMLYLDTRTRTLRFRVVDIRVVNPSDVAVLAPTAVPSITLVTCYPFYFVGPAPQRFIVRAERDEGVGVRRVSTGPADFPTQE